MTPQGWQEKTLGEILDKGSSNLSANKLTDCVGIYPVYGAAGLIAKVNFYQQDKEYLAIIKDGAGVGRVYHYQPKTSVLGTLQYLYPKSNTNIRFAYYYLQSIDFAKYYQGAAIPHIYYRDYKSEKLVLPPLPEQERIVTKLDEAFEAIDKVKANAEQNLNNAKELFETALNNAFTENTDGWEEKTLGEVSQIISGTTPDTSNPDFWGKGNYWVTPAEINEDNLYIRKTDREITNLAIESCSLRKMPRGTIIFSSRAPIGKIAISDVDTLYCNQGFKNFICSKNIYNKFLYYFLLKNKKYIISLGKGTTFKEVSKGIISAVNIQYPSLPEQHKIVEKLDKLQEQTKQLEAIYTKKIKDLDELKQSILQKAFRGEL